MVEWADQGTDRAVPDLGLAWAAAEDQAAREQAVAPELAAASAHQEAAVALVPACGNRAVGQAAEAARGQAQAARVVEGEQAVERDQGAAVVVVARGPAQVAEAEQVVERDQGAEVVVVARGPARAVEAEQVVGRDQEAAVGVA